MKDRFLELVRQIPEIEKLFHYVSVPRGVQSPGTPEIGDRQEFVLWLQEVRLEVQQIVDLSDDSFAKETLAALSVKFDGWSDVRKFNDVKGRLLAMEKNIDRYYLPTKPTAEENKPIKIFISHSSADKEQVAKIVDLFDGMGLDQTQVFCSSLPGYGIPNDQNILDFLILQFNHFQLHMVIIHSHNYYTSPVCLNEMGAAWVLRTSCTSILLPGFGFGDMKGAVNSERIAIKLDNDINEVKDRLNQLYDTVIEEFGLTRKAPIIWEQKRDSFIREINSIHVIR